MTDIRLSGSSTSEIELSGSVDKTIIMPGEFLPNPMNLVTSCACEFWYDGQDTATVHLVGADVEQWDDKSGNDRHVTQAVAGLRPAYDPLTGRLTFDSIANTFLNIANFDAPLAQPITIFIISQITNLAASALCMLDGGVNDADRIAFYKIGGAGSFLSIWSGVALPNGLFDNNDNIHCGEWNGLASNYWINGALVAGPGNAGAQSLDGLTIGKLIAAANFELNGDIMEIFGYNCLCTIAERAALFNYGNTKWGL